MVSCASDDSSLGERAQRAVPRAMVFAPSPLLTITVEALPDGAAETHLHAGGQGVWIGRMLARLGVGVLLCGPFGGETGAVLAMLVEREGIGLRRSPSAAGNGSYIHDRRGGKREVIVSAAPPALPRHELDELYSITLVEGLESDVAVLAGPDGERVLAPQTYRRLASDLTGGGVPVIADLSGEYLASRPADSLASMVTELADRQRRLDLFDVSGDPQTAVRAVFSWSYRQLDPAVARAFRLAGVHPGPELDVYALAALTDTTQAQAARLLGELVRAHLIHPARPGRHAMHDLLRDYAAEQAAAVDGETGCRAALTRLLDHYLHTAAAAMDTLMPAERHRRPAAPRPATPVPPVTEAGTARTWLDDQRPALVAAAGHAATHGWPRHATQMAATLFRYLDAGGHYPEAIAVHTWAGQAARHGGDQAAEAEALTSLGIVAWRQGRCQQAAQHHRRALKLFRRAGDRTGETRTLANLALVDLRLGRYQQATAHLRQALELFRQTGDRSGEGRTLSNLGLIDLRQGHYQRAAGHYRQALALCRQTGDQGGQAHALGNLGVIDLRQGRYQQASDQQRQALDLFRQTGDRASEAYALTSLGEADLRQGDCEQATAHLQQAQALFRDTGDRTGAAHALASLGEVDLRQGRCEQAIHHLQQALELFRETGERFGEVQTLNGFGEAFLAAGQPGQARTRHAAALALASKLGDVDQQARAHGGLAQVHRAAGDLGQARDHWQQAVALYTGLGSPEAGRIGAILGSLDPGPDNLGPGPDTPPGHDQRHR